LTADPGADARAGHDPPDDAYARFKADRLRRMRQLATSLLGLMLAIVSISVIYQSRHPWLHWMRAFAEAAAVGALADWYAVTALFRHPLGLAIPHTAIIPRNKDRIAESLGDFVEQNFLTPENITAKLRELDTAQALAQWLSVRNNASAVASAVADIFPVILSGLRDEEVRQFFDRTLTPQLLSLNPSRVAGNVLEMMTEGEQHQALLDWTLQALERWLVAKQGLIEAKFSEASRYTPPGVDRYVVNKFMQGIIALLHEVAANPRHELREQFDRAVRTLIRDLMTSEDYRRKGQDLLRRFVEHLQTENFYRVLWEDVRSRVQADVQSDSSLMRGHIVSALTALGEGLLADPVVRQKLNGWWLDAVHRVVVRFRHQISALIRDVVKSWDADQVSRKLELEVGKDLQYIRINGTFVGGTAGLLLHAGIYFWGR
jgi:uncharacterized membrane-anchored protein YjiN (DUF445 family)